MAPVIITNHLSKYYKLARSSFGRRKVSSNVDDPDRFHSRLGFAALRDVTLEISKGDAVALVGRNGAGKTSLLRILAGVARPTRGSVEIRGRTSSLLGVRTGMNPKLSGRQNIALYGALMGFSRSDLKRHFPEIIEFSGLGQFIDQPVASYSPGMAARLGFATALQLDPEILLIDEVLAVGDPSFQARAFARMRRFFTDGRTVVLATHNLAAVSNLCSRVVWLDAGRVRRAGPTDDVLESYRRSCFRGQDLPSEPSEEALPSGVALELTNSVGYERRRFSAGESVHGSVIVGKSDLAAGSMVMLSLFDPVSGNLVLEEGCEARVKKPAAHVKIGFTLDTTGLPPRAYRLELLSMTSGANSEGARLLVRDSFIVYDPSESSAVNSSAPSCQLHLDEIITDAPGSS